MAHDVVQMDYDVMTNVSKGFATQSKTLQTISKVLQGVIQVLRAMAFLSGGTSAALAQYLGGAGPVLPGDQGQDRHPVQDLRRVLGRPVQGRHRSQER